MPISKNNSSNITVNNFVTSSVTEIAEQFWVSKQNKVTFNTGSIEVTGSAYIKGDITASNAELTNAYVSDTLEINSAWDFFGEAEGGTERLVLQGKGANDASELFLQSKGTADEARLTLSPDEDTNNYGGLEIDATNDSTSINSIKAGSGTIRPIDIGITGSAIMSIATNGDVTFSTGSVTVDEILYASSISGSLTRLTDGSSYILAGDGISTSTGSTGQITIGAEVTQAELDSVSGSIAADILQNQSDILMNASGISDNTDDITSLSGSVAADVNRLETDISDNTTEITSVSSSFVNHKDDSTIHFTEASIDHGAISGLGGDDHTQYILVDGTRAFSGDIDLANNQIDNVDDIQVQTINGVTSSAIGSVDVYMTGSLIKEDAQTLNFSGDAVQSIQLSGSGVTITIQQAAGGGGSSDINEYDVWSIVEVFS